MVALAESKAADKAACCLCVCVREREREMKGEEQINNAGMKSHFQYDCNLSRKEAHVGPPSCWWCDAAAPLGETARAAGRRKCRCMLLWVVEFVRSRLLRLMRLLVVLLVGG